MTIANGHQVALTRGRIIVRNRKKKKKKKRRYSSRPLKSFQQRLNGMLRVSDRVASAISRGVLKFRRRSRKSARKKRDGLLRDLPKNAARGLGETIRVSSKIPRDVVRVFRPRFLKR